MRREILAPQELPASTRGVCFSFYRQLLHSRAKNDTLSQVIINGRKERLTIMKRFLSVLLAMTVLMLGGPTSVAADCDVDGHTFDYTNVCSTCGLVDISDFSYTVKNGEVTVTRYEREDGEVPLEEVTVPGVIEGYPVTALGSGAFSSSIGLKVVTLPQTLKTIPQYAFSQCHYLEQVKGGRAITAIEHRAFYECFYLSSYTIPETVMEIGEKAFYKCTALTEIFIPNTVTKMGGSAFNGCTALTKAHIGSGLETLDGNGVFGYCDKLTAITVAEENTAFRSIDGVLFQKICPS